MESVINIDYICRNENGHYIQDADTEEEPEAAVMFPSMRLLIAGQIYISIINIEIMFRVDKVV